MGTLKNVMEWAVFHGLPLLPHGFESFNLSLPTYTTFPECTKPTILGLDNQE